MTERRLAMAVEVACRAPDDHPFRVGVTALRNSLGMDGFILALLHDSLEDGYITDEEFSRLPMWMREALVAISRKKTESYAQYINRLSEGPMNAKLVKLCDLKVNLARCTEPKHKQLARRYERAQERLSRSLLPSAS